MIRREPGLGMPLLGFRPKAINSSPVLMGVMLLAPSASIHSQPGGPVTMETV